jgi:hypothetical protein
MTLWEKVRGGPVQPEREGTYRGSTNVHRAPSPPCSGSERHVSELILTTAMYVKAMEFANVCGAFWWLELLHAFNDDENCTEVVPRKKVSDSLGRQVLCFFVVLKAS